METNFKEQLNDHRPYWKVIVSLVFSLIATILFVYVGMKLLIYFMPFVIGWFIAYAVSPLVNWLEKRLKIVKKLGSAIIIILVLAAVTGILYLAFSRLFHEIVSLIQDLPTLYRELESGFDSIGESMTGVFNMLPSGLQEGWTAVRDNMDAAMGELMGRVSEPTVMAAGNFAKRIPSALISVIVTIISAYFFVAEREDLIRLSKKIAPDAIVTRMTLVMDNLKYAVGGYFKAQFKIMTVVFAILLISFTIFDIHFSLILAILIAFLDFLPFFGTGTAMIPWALYKFLVGNYKMAIGLIIVYGITQLVRQVIQPKLVGDSIGMNPLLTLVLLYIGYKVGGVFGMIFAVPVGMIVINLFKAGAFDYILDDVKILGEGILSLRE
ncbi:sporulation integral membrane protein YtvI [Faecalicatena contorta]|uniref:sporulation integral membrane protein YtvI n=1 Tax=Faecalicatena contorta TaxID=39482 RepID=UPI001F3A461A|nr:sporulation integral membrane protein YtvI [Faecalicatena contorta]MCF2554855.1 sporulation integral membrane protein YtvI [Faecalicatena contorta]